MADYGRFRTTARKSTGGYAPVSQMMEVVYRTRQTARKSMGPFAARSFVAVEKKPTEEELKKQKEEEKKSLEEFEMRMQDLQKALDKFDLEDKERREKRKIAYEQMALDAEKNWPNDL